MECLWHLCNQAAKEKFCSKKCKNKYNVTMRRIRIRRMAVVYKGGSCQSCGYTGCDDVFDFHHRDPSQKDFQIGGSTKGWQKIREELDKCDLLCANCHREHHAGEKATRYIQERVVKELPL